MRHPRQSVYLEKRSGRRIRRYASAQPIKVVWKNQIYESDVDGLQKHGDRVFNVGTEGRQPLAPRATATTPWSQHRVTGMTVTLSKP
jgi:hypothetical protein